MSAEYTSTRPGPLSWWRVSSFMLWAIVAGALVLLLGSALLLGRGTGGGAAARPGQSYLVAAGVVSHLRIDIAALPGAGGGARASQLAIEATQAAQTRLAAGATADDSLVGAYRHMAQVASTLAAAGDVPTSQGLIPVHQAADQVLAALG